jgi:hypothetical protein
MSDADRDARRARALRFVASAAFGRHYDKLYIPARQWFIGQLIPCLTIVGLPGGIRRLLNSGNQALAAEELVEGFGNGRCRLISPLAGQPTSSTSRSTTSFSAATVFSERRSSISWSIRARVD